MVWSQLKYECIIVDAWSALDSSWKWLMGRAAQQIRISYPQFWYASALFSSRNVHFGMIIFIGAHKMCIIQKRRSKASLTLRGSENLKARDV